MCGIAGWVDFKKDLKKNFEDIKNMSKTLIKRGPDEGGFYINNHALFAHRRLIVVDACGGKQPMTFRRDEEKYIIIYNGELYNADELRNELKSSGFVFKGRSDTEVLLKAYVHWKEDCLSHLNGIFAFGIFSEHDQKLFLARDRMGVKPLFFYVYNEGIIFGSEIKTLLANSLIKPVIDEQGLKEIFLLGPARSSGFGVIKDVEELKRSEYLIFKKNYLNKSIYWKLKAFEFKETKEESIEKLRYLISDSIKRQLVSDVPLCCFLSGGLDSSIICDQASKNLNKTLATYSVDYINSQKYFTKSLYQPNFDLEYINEMSYHISSNHKNIILDNLDLVNSLDEALLARDLPGMADIDSSLLLFCKEVKKDFTVALSGECADEIFGGYPWYHNKKLLNFNGFPWSRHLTFRKSILKDGILKNCEEYVKNLYESTVKKVDFLATDSKFDKKMREMFILNIDWFMQVLLDRKDRMSMYNGLEIRVPFCDHRIVEYTYNMPWHIKSSAGREKGILREAMIGILPKKIVERKKSPYPKTFSPFYLRTINKKLEFILEKKSVLNEIINIKNIRKIMKNPEEISEPWYGQLMEIPQVLAYIIQLDKWFSDYKIQIM